MGIHDVFLGCDMAVEFFRSGTCGNTSIISWPMVYRAKSFNNLLATFTSSMSSYVHIVSRCAMTFSLSGIALRGESY